MFAIDRKMPPRGTAVKHRHRSMCAAVALQNLFPACDAVARQQRSQLEGTMFCELYPVLGFAFEPVVCGIGMHPADVSRCLRIRWQSASTPQTPQNWAIFAAREEVEESSHFVLLLRSQGLICEVNAIFENIQFARPSEWVLDAQEKQRHFTGVYQLYNFPTRLPMVLADAQLQHLVHD